MERLTENFLGCYQIKGCDNFTCEETCNNVLNCGCCPISEAINKLAEYEDLEEQGLLLRLPCKVGDTVYIKMASYCDIKYAEAEVRDFTHFTSCGFCVVITSKYFDKQNIPFSEFGKTVFLTQAEAEKKLKEMERIRIQRNI